MSHDSHASENTNEVNHEPAPLSRYLLVAGALLTLTAVTVGVALVDFGQPWNLVVAMLVASIKAMLVVMYFMNLLHDHDRLNGVVFGSALLFLAVFFTFTIVDVTTRGDVNPKKGQDAPLPTAAYQGALK